MPERAGQLARLPRSPPPVRGGGPGAGTTAVRDVRNSDLPERALARRAGTGDRALLITVAAARRPFRSPAYPSARAARRLPPRYLPDFASTTVGTTPVR